MKKYIILLVLFIFCILYFRDKKNIDNVNAGVNYRGDTFYSSHFVALEVTTAPAVISNINGLNRAVLRIYREGNDGDVYIYSSVSNNTNVTKSTVVSDGLKLLTYSTGSEFLELPVGDNSKIFTVLNAESGTTTIKCLFFGYPTY